MRDRIPVAVESDEPWQLEAACRGHFNSDIFLYPLPGPNKHLRDMAVAVCDTCPVTEQCVRAGLDAPGIWGGLTESERTGRRRNRNERVDRVRQRPLDEAQALLNEEAFNLAALGNTHDQIASHLGLHRATVYRRIRSHKDTLAGLDLIH